MPKVTDDAIRKKAYELWQQRGCPADSDVEDWLAAEWVLRYSKRKNGLKELCKKYGLREFSYGLKELQTT